MPARLRPGRAALRVRRGGAVLAGLLFLCGVAAIPGAARAQTVRDPGAPPAATLGRADSVVVDSASAFLGPGRVLEFADPNSPAARRARRDSIRVAHAGLLDQPRFVMLRSLIVPGWGQLHNRAWFKAILIAGGEGIFISDLIEDEKKLKDLDREIAALRPTGDYAAQNAAIERYNARLNHLVGREWLLGGLLVYSLMDAYVDAHFVNFQFEFQHDSARPEGVRLGLEKRF